MSDTRTKLGRKILDLQKDSGARLVYGVMATSTTCYIDGSTTAVTATKLDSVGPLAAGDYVSLLKSGADAIIVGTIGVALGTRPQIQSGDQLSSVASNIHTITYPTAMAGTPRLLSLAVRIASGGDYTTTLRTISSTAITFEIYVAGAIFGTARQINWSVGYFG